MKKIIVEPKEFGTLKALIPFIDFKVNKGMITVFIALTSMALATELGYEVL